MSGEPQFLTREHIEILHKYEIRRYGGIPGLRAEDRLLAAVQAPCSTWAGRYLYSYPFEMAAVYLESLARGHAFLDGNKRTALAAALLFLRLNGWWVERTHLMFQTVMGVATGTQARSDAATLLERHARKIV